MHKVIIGIDPGLKGAIAVINAETKELLGLEDCPTMINDRKPIYDVGEMAAVIRRFCLLGDATVILEQQQAMPKQGVSSTFTIGRGFGIWQGILGALEIPYRIVRPMVWTKRIFTGMPGEGKFRAIQFAMQMFPGIELTPQRCRTPKDGRADAACLAYWGTVA